MQARLAIVIVNFRTPGVTVDCLRTLAAEVAANQGVRVVVVENGSGDTSAVQLREAIERHGWQNWCDLVVSDRNWGFSGGNNRGYERVMETGGAEYILLLNSDTLVEPGCVRFCLDVMDRDKSVGALSCRLLNRDGTVQNTCRKFPTPLRCLAATFSLPWRLPRLFSWADCDDEGWDRNRTARDVEWIGGAFMMLRGPWVEKHGLLDERFFFYGEDIEICHRVWRSGLRCRYEPGATITHLGGASSDPSRMAAGKRNIHSWRGRYLVQRYCYGAWAEWLLRVQDVCNVGLRVLWGRLRRRTASPAHAAMVEELRVLRTNWSRWSKPVG